MTYFEVLVLGFLPFVVGMLLFRAQEYVLFALLFLLSIILVPVGVGTPAESPAVRLFQEVCAAYAGTCLIGLLGAVFVHSIHQIWLIITKS